MDNLPFDEDEIKNIEKLHASVRFTRNNNLTIEESNKTLIKRSSSMSLKSPKNFVPKLKPIPTIICPSPINLDQKSPLPIPEIQNTTISTSSFDSQNDHNLKPIKYIYSRKAIKKKSFKILNIEEEVYAISDCESNSKKLNDSHSDSDNSKSVKIENSKNINIMRKNMAKLRKSLKSNENLLDDSDIDNHFVGKRLNQYQNIRQRTFIKEIRRKKNFGLNPLRKIKYRTKSFNMKSKYVSTILGFLEKNNSANSFNSNGK